MKVTITLTVRREDSKEEVMEEIDVLREIIGADFSRGEQKDDERTAIYEGEFYEFYLRVKERIIRRFKAYE